MSLIVDASVALKWGVEEDKADAAEALFTRGKLIAPDLVVAEISNALWKKETRGELAPDQRLTALAACTKGFDEFVPGGDLAVRSLELAHELKHPVYDCFYLALTEMRSGTLVTADARLLAKLRSNGWKGSFEAL